MRARVLAAALAAALSACGEGVPAPGEAGAFFMYADGERRMRSIDSPSSRVCTRSVCVPLFAK